jgi:hypothetical protein
MKRLQKPTLRAIDVFDSCVTGITEKELAEKFSSARVAIEAQFTEYETRATAHSLATFVACDWGKKHQIIVGGLSKGELVDLYTSQMAAKASVGRTHYDQILMLAPLGICPFCGFGHASTLDHFLSKSRFPAFSVLPLNLIPACKDCNTGKGASVAGSAGQMVHPYFEGDSIHSDAWLFAEVLQTAPATVRYHANPPTTWSVDLRSRTLSYFEELNLALRFSVQAASEIIEISELLATLGSPADRKEHLDRMTHIERTSRKNSWKAPLYEALAASDWYIETGHQNTQPE